MDNPPFLNVIFQSFTWIFPLAIIIGAIKSPWGKGIIGELLVKIIARIRLDRNIYHRVHNVTLPIPDGTTQIDHVFVSRYGLFVLETKYMQGWIFGGENQAQWTQKIYKKSFKFQNPLRQNFKHIKALENALQIPAATIHSLIVFIGNSTFKTEMPLNVTKDSEFVSYIKSFQEVVFSNTEVADLLQKIESRRLTPTLLTAWKHVQSLKARAEINAERRHPGIYRRRNNDGSLFGGLLHIASSLPPWLGGILAILSFLILHQYSDITPPASSNTNDIFDFIPNQLFKTFALFFQLILPAIFMMGAGFP